MLEKFTALSFALLLCAGPYGSAAAADTASDRASDAAQALSPNMFAPASASDSDAPDPNIARGVIRPGQTAEIAAAMSGKLTSAPYADGQYFSKGAVLAEFNCTRQRAEKTAKTRAYNTLQLKYENISELYSAGAAGELEVSIAKSEMEQASAEKEVIEARLSDCTVHAPFSGYVLTQHVRAHETPAVNAPLYSILKANSLEVSIIAPSAWMRWMKTGTPLSFTVDETGTQFKAKIIRIGAAVDPVSQTIEIKAAPTQKIGRTLAGMSGIARFTPPKPRVKPPVKPTTSGAARAAK